MVAINYSLGPIYDFLWEKLPQHRHKDGKLDVRGLARAAGTSDKAFYKAFTANRLTSGMATAIVKASEGKIAPADLAHFVFV